MNKNNTIPFATYSICTSCKERILAEYQTHTIPFGNNSVVGPGFRSYQHSYFEVTYYCAKCGLCYQPTLTNKLAEKEEVRTKLVKKLFETTKSCTLSKRLSSYEVFQWSGKEKQKISKPSKKEIEMFESGVYLRMYKPNQGLSFVFDEYPYFVKDKNTYKVVFWSKLKVHSFQAGISKKTKKFTMPKKTPKLLENKLLPKSAVPAVKVFHPLLLEDYYVPENVLG